MSDEIDEPEDDGGIPDVVITLLEIEDGPDEAGIGKGIRDVLQRVREAGWERVELRTSLVHVSDEFRKADSKKKPGQTDPDHRKGELTKAAHERRHWWVLGVQPRAFAAFQAEWIEGVTPKGGRSFGFKSAYCTDLIGQPTELFIDFAPSKNDLRQVKDEPSFAHQERVRRIMRITEDRDRAYNLGTTWLNRTPLYKAFGQFDDWLEGAISTAEQIVAKRDAAENPTERPDTEPEGIAA